MIKNRKYLSEMEKKAWYKLFESIRDEMRMQRILMDKNNLFESELDKMWKNIKPKKEKKERPEPPPTFSAKNVTVEVKPTKQEATPQQIADFNPENIEWEEFTSKKGKLTWRHPFLNQPVSASADYKGLREAMNLANKRYFNHGEYYYFFSDDKGTIFRQKSQRRG